MSIEATRQGAAHGPRESMPQLGEIAAAWARLSFDERRAIFPELAAHLIGWGEPFCFRCGWLSPTTEAAAYNDLDAERAIGKAWNAASGWLERAHLHDHQHGGSEAPANLVPLCVVCHEYQPTSVTRDAGVAFVNETPDHLRLVPLIQLLTDEWYRNARRPGHAEAVRRMYRAHAAAGSTYAKVIAEAL